MSKLRLIVAIATALTFSIATPAFAASSNADSRLTNIKQKCDSAVQNRLSTIGTLETRINTSKNVSSSHKSGLLAELDSDKSGLTSLDAKVQADTTATQAVSDCKGVVSDYRIYVLEVPKVHEVLVADDFLQISTTLQTLSPKLAQQLTTAKNNGVDVSAAENALADLNSKASSIQSSVSPLAGPVLALQPSGWPGNKPTLQSTRKTLGDAKTSAQAARQDLKTIAGVLKAAKGSTTTISTAKPAS